MRQTQAMLPSDTSAHLTPDSAATAATDTTACTAFGSIPAPRVALVYQFTRQRERGPLLGNPLLDLLQATRQSGSISGAARQLGLSYRHVWGQLKEWEIEVGQPLILWDRGQAARLTPFADKLLWAERLAQARLAPQIEALRAELERALASVFDERTQVLGLHASHDDALSALQDLASQQASLHLDIHFTGSVDAIRSLNEGRCQLAGFHTRQRPDRHSLTARTYKPLLKPGKHKIIGFALRQMGLMVPPRQPAAPAQPETGGTVAGPLRQPATGHRHPRAAGRTAGRNGTVSRKPQRLRTLPAIARRRGPGRGQRAGRCGVGV